MKYSIIIEIKNDDLKNNANIIIEIGTFESGKLVRF